MQISTQQKTWGYIILILLTIGGFIYLYINNNNKLANKKLKLPDIQHIKNLNFWIIVGGIFLIIGLTIAYVSINVVDTYEENVEEIVEENVKEIVEEIVKEPIFIVYVNDGCPWCKKFKEIYGNNPLFVIVNINNSIEKLKQLNLHTQGVPLVCLIKEPEKYVAGFMPTQENYIRAFQEKYGEKENYQEKPVEVAESKEEVKSVEAEKSEEETKQVELTDIQRVVKDLKLIVFVSDNCGHCKNLKQILHQHNCLDLVTLLPASHQRLNSCVECANAGGVPCSYSEALKTSFVGCPQNINQYLNMLTDNKEVLDNGENLKPKMPTCGKPFRSKNSGNSTYSSVSKMYANASDKVRSYVPQESCY